jgi:hypothetical protein
MSKERKIFGKWTQYGFSFRRFALGFHIDKYSLSLDLIFGWVTVEL